MPSNSNPQRSSRSSGRSRKSKRRSRKKSSDQLAGRDSKSFQDHGIDFFALLMGLVAASIIGFLGYSYLFSGSPALELDQKDESQIAQQLLGVNPGEFKKLLADSNLDQQLRMLNALNRWATEPMHQEDVKVQRRRVQVADRMMGEALNPSQRYLVISSKLEARMSLHQMIRKHGLKEPSVEHQLRDDLKQHRTDDDDRLAIQSRMLLVQLSASAAAPDVPLIAKELYALATEYPDKPEVHGLLGQIVDEQMNVAEKREAGGRLVKRLLQLEERDEDSKVEETIALREIFDKYRDWSTLNENGFFEAWDSRSFSGQISFGHLREVTLKLAAEKTAGEKLLFEIRRVANWFEQSREYEFALPIYQALADQAAGYQNPLISSAARVLGNQGLTRCQLVGQPFQLEGQLFSGEPLEAGEFQGRLVLVVYFSLAEDRSVETLDFLLNESPAWKGESVKQVAVCVDKRGDPAFDSERLATLENLLAGWKMIVRDDEGGLPFFDQCPATTFPRIVLLDKGHRVYDVNVRRNDVKGMIDYVLISDESE